MADTLEPGLSALRTLDWYLGGLLVSGNEGEADTSILMDYFEGLDGIGEIDGEDEELYGDGSAPGHQRITSRAVTLGLSLAPPGFSEDDVATNFEELLQAVRKVMHPLPNRHTGTRLFRWRLAGGPAKRLWVRPANGEAVSVPGNAERTLYGGAEVVCRLEAPDPVITSDVLHNVTFTAGETKTIVNAGSSTAVMPCAWSVTASGPVAIENLDFDEYVLFTGGGAITTKPNRDAYPAVAYGHAGRLYPRWPLLRPGDNQIKASAPCTFSWRDTY